MQYNALEAVSLVDMNNLRSRGCKETATHCQYICDRAFSLSFILSHILVHCTQRYHCDLILIVKLPAAERIMNRQKMQSARALLLQRIAKPSECIAVAGAIDERTLKELAVQVIMSANRAFQ